MSQLVAGVEAMAGGRSQPKQKSAGDSVNISKNGSSHNSDSEYNLCITSSLQEGLHRAGYAGISGGASQLQAVATTRSKNTKELDKAMCMIDVNTIFWLDIRFVMLGLQNQRKKRVIPIPTGTK